MTLTHLLASISIPVPLVNLVEDLKADQRQLHLTAQLGLVEAPAEQFIVLVVDQFEEIFTLCRDESQRVAFINNLLYASSVKAGRVIVVMTMRADFYAKCATHPELAARITDHQMLVSPMSAEELWQAIKQPAQKVGLEFEPGLAETLLNEIKTEPGALPLLQHTLLELWERREKNRLTFSAYREIGGIEGAIAHRAESIYAGFNQQQQVLTRRIMLRLTQPGEGTEDTRRQVLLAELLPIENERIETEDTLKELADARLLTTGKDDAGNETVDVAHEALIRGWPRLRSWIDEGRVSLRIHRRLTEAATEWQRHQRDASYLYRGARLLEVEEWLAANPSEINTFEQEFIEASIQAREVDRTQHQLLEQTQAARQEAEALYEVARTLVATEDEQEMLSTVLQKMLTTLGLLQGGVLFFEEDRKFGKLHALFVNGEPAEPGLRFPIEGNPSYEKLIATKRPVAIEDALHDPLLVTVREIIIPMGIISMLLVPIIINDEVIGALGADVLGQPHHFSEREINLAIGMADQLSIMLQNRHLLEETKRRAVQLQTSFDISRFTTSILDQEIMLGQAVELIRDRFGFYHVQIFLIDEAKQFAVLYKSTGEAGRKLLALGHKLAIGSQSVIGHVTYQRRPVVVRKTNTPQASPLYRRNEFLPETRAELAIPLQVGDTLIGALDVQSTLPNAFTSEDISILETLAAQLAIAIQNARAFAEQQETAERLKEIDKLKTQFLANVSHELRTPLNSIVGFSRVILKGIDGPLTELQKTDLTSIHNSGQHILGLVNNFLDISKIGSGKMELNFEEVELEPMIKGIMAIAVTLVAGKPITLFQDIPGNLPTIWADPTRIRQILLNLVSNACKFTDQGQVTIHARADQERVIISVSDTGIGIPEENLTSIFEEFTQVDSSTTRKVGGTGLGLPISRHFVEMHKGHIWVESKLGYGSTFYFTIPIKQLVEAEKEWPANFAIDLPKKGQGKVIVAIDDDPGVITLYERFLEQQDYRVIGINHSYDVLPQVKELAPAAILLDVLMPEKDGWGVLRALKGDPVTQNIPVIICSIISDKNRGFSLGAADYLIKPIVENELVRALKHLENQSKERVKILVVDDQSDDILLIRRIFEAQSNYKIFEAHNGHEGLELVQNVEPDLIILDLIMPGMDGFMVVETLKNNEKTRSIPIIITSAKELTSAEHLALTGQVEVLLRKGIFTENELLQDVSQALKRNKKQSVNTY